LGGVKQRVRKKKRQGGPPQRVWKRIDSSLATAMGIHRKTRPRQEGEVFDLSRVGSFTEYAQGDALE